MKFRRKPLVFEAEQFIWQRNEPECVKTKFIGNNEFCWVIDTLEGEYIVSDGDWIVTGINGEKWAVKPDIFEATYELADFHVEKNIEQIEKGEEK